MIKCKISQKIKLPKFPTKNALFEYFWARASKNYCDVWNQHSQICLIGKFCEETKMPKFGTTNVFLGIFDQNCLSRVF